MFISFEGIEGSGKSTQIQLVSDYLNSKSYKVVQTFEPGATAFGASIRRLLLDPDTVLKDSYSELLLFLSDRLEHLKQVVEPALAKGSIVLTDRFTDSTLAYQLGGRQLEEKQVRTLLSCIPIEPDLTFLLDSNPYEGLRRAKSRAALDRFEQENIEFHHRVRNTFLSIAKDNDSRVVTINVDGISIEDVFEEIKGVLNNRLNSKGESNESNC